MPTAPDSEKVRLDVLEYRALRGRPRSAQQLLENAYLGYLDKFLKTGVTPMPCHALRASCFVDPWGVVYPCISYSRPIGRLRDTGMRLDPIWNARDTRELQGEIWKGQCPQCWTACEAYQSILGNVLAGRCGTQSAEAPCTDARGCFGIRAPAMNVTCYTDAVIQAHLGRAVAHHLRDDVSVVIAAKQEAPSIAGVIERTSPYASDVVVVVGHSTDGTSEVAAQKGARVMADGGLGKGEAIRRAIPTINRPVTVFLDADGSHDPEDIPLLVEPILADRADHVSASRLQRRVERAARRIRRILPPDRQLVHHGVHQLAIQLPAQRESERLPGDPHVGPQTTGPEGEHHHHRAGDDHQDAAAWIPDGRSAESRASARPRRLAHPRVAQCAAVRLFARQVSVLLNVSSAALVTR